jgi:hypothetical protein
VRALLAIGSSLPSVPHLVLYANVLGKLVSAFRYSVVLTCTFCASELLMRLMRFTIHAAVLWVGLDCMEVNDSVFLGGSARGQVTVQHPISHATSL